MCTAAAGPPTPVARLTRFIDLASTFHLPLIHLEDCPGFVIGKKAEQEATIRFGSQALAALGQAPVPFCSVVLRKAFGVAGAANRKPGSEHFRFAWPSGDWGSLPIEGGIEVAYKAELQTANNYQAHLDMLRERRQPRAFSVSLRRVLRDRGDHRPANHKAGALPLGQPGSTLRDEQKSTGSVTDRSRYRASAVRNVCASPTEPCAKCLTALPLGLDGRGCSEAPARSPRSQLRAAS